jgi:predicted Fe-Mo cluster-binding NifX family protein
MRIAVTAKGDGLSSELDPRFGRAKWIILLDSETGIFEARDNTENLSAAKGAGIQTGKDLARLGVEVVITGNIGPNASKTMKEAKVRVYHTDAPSVQDAIVLFNAGKLKRLNDSGPEGYEAHNFFF